MAGVAAQALLLGPLAWRLGGRTVAGLERKERADAINAARQTLLTATGGTVVLVGIGFTARTYYLTRRGQLTDRYTRAIGQLASSHLTERLGGIYALEGLMVESHRDHGTVVEVLAAFIRENSRIPDTTRRISTDDAATEPPPVPMEYPTEGGRCPTDTQAALTVLARRPERMERNPLDLSHVELKNAQLQGALLRRANLRGTHLTGACLISARLECADLTETQLRDADLTGAQLQKAEISAAQLSGADLDRVAASGATLTGALMCGTSLVGARLQHANMVGADLQGADLTGANLQHANLMKANLQGAYLRRAHLHGTRLTGASHLSVELVSPALWDETTEIEENLRRELNAARREHEQDQG